MIQRRQTGYRKRSAPEAPKPTVMYDLHGVAAVEVSPVTWSLFRLDGSKAKCPEKAVTARLAFGPRDAVVDRALLSAMGSRQRTLKGRSSELWAPPIA
jgi:hypothetical protein